MSSYEVLAPVGNYKELNIVLDEAPDAIYVGMMGLTSRPSRTDFSQQEIEDAIKICHDRDVRIYVAINSGVRESEIHQLIEVMKSLDMAGVDGFIIADYGLIYATSGMFVNAEIHASTLLGAYNIETVRILKGLGVKRIIFYANMYLDEIIQITNTFPELDYELVAEGGTCFNDIRQCRLPHIISDNQHILTCRTGCVLFENDKMVRGKLLAENPCRVAEVIGIYMAAGIKSFKIEGRTVPASERVQIIRDVKSNIKEFENGKPVNSYLHYISRMRREIL